MADNPKHKDKQDSKGFSKGKKEAPRKNVKTEAQNKRSGRRG